MLSETIRDPDAQIIFEARDSDFSVVGMVEICVTGITAEEHDDPGRHALLDALVEQNRTIFVKHFFVLCCSWKQKLFFLMRHQKKTNRQGFR